MTKEEFENMGFGINMKCYYRHPEFPKNDMVYNITAINFFEGLIEMDDRGDPFWARHEHIELILNDPKVNNSGE